MSAWGGPPSSGAWANQVDEEEEANGGELAPVPLPSKEPLPALGGQQNFPALGEALSSKENKRDRKKKQATQKMSLTTFIAAQHKEPEQISLPTGPRARAEGEDDRKQGGLGGGFKNYGGERGDRYGDRNRDRDDGFKGMDDDGPSRADAVDDWGTKKAFVPSERGSSRGGFSEGGFRDKERSGGGFSDRYSERRTGFGEGDFNRADDADRWNNKNFESGSSRRGGFEDRDKERYGGFSGREDYGPSKADSEDRWSRRPSTTDSIERRDSGASSGQRPRLSLKPRSTELPLPAPPATSSRASEASTDDTRDSPIVSKPSGPRSNPFGQAKPVDIREKVPEPRSESSNDRASREPSPGPAIPKPRSNPFGSARPREEVLKEKGPTQSPEPEAESHKAAESQEDSKTGVQNDVLSLGQGTGAVSADQGAASSDEKPVSESKTEQQQPESIVEKAVENAQSAVEAVREKLENGLTTSDKTSEPENKQKSEPEASKPAATSTGSTWAKIASG